MIKNKKKTLITIGLAFAGVVLAGAVTFTGISLGMTTNALGQYKTQLEHVYQRNLYELTENVNNIESNLAKLRVCTDPQVQERYLASVVALSNTAQDNISTLPIEHNSISDTIKFVNQLSGYSLILQQNLAKGEEITLDDFAQIDSLHASSQNIKYELNRLTVMVSGGYSIVDNISDPNQNSNAFDGEFAGLHNEIMDYPQLIYDGPFSESTTNKEIKGLSSNEINAEEAKNRLEKWFEGYSVRENGETKGGNFDTFDFILTKGESEYYAQVSVRDGVLLQLNSNHEARESLKTEDESRTIAEHFATLLGFEDMKAVWSATSQGFAYINLTPIIDDVVVYPDLIKVKVALDSGEVAGWEAQSWAYNHTDRANLVPSITSVQAQKAVTQDMDIRTTTLCIMPNQYVGESLVYEFMCVNSGATYYIYVDAKTGVQVNILKVIETSDGNLLM